MADMIPLVSTIVYAKALAYSAETTSGLHFSECKLNDSSIVFSIAVLVLKIVATMNTRECVATRQMLAGSLGQGSRLQRTDDISLALVKFQISN